VKREKTKVQMDNKKISICFFPNKTRSARPRVMSEKKEKATN